MRNSSEKRKCFSKGNEENRFRKLKCFLVIKTFTFFFFRREEDGKEIQNAIKQDSGFDKKNAGKKFYQSCLTLPAVKYYGK